MILQEIIDSAGVYHRSNKGKQDEINLDCPFCIERGLSADDKQHLGLNVSDGRAHCFRCGWKSRTILNTARNLCRVYGLPDMLRLIGSKQPVKPTKKIEEPTPISGLPKEYEAFGKTDEKDPIEQEAKEYLRARGISYLQILRHKIGYAVTGTMGWRILFPVFNEENVIAGCVGRALRKDMKPKYLNSVGSKLLWNANRQGSMAVVCEGIFDALRVESVLLQWRNAVAVSRLGSAITPHQLNQLKKYEKVVILPDWDQAGVHGAISLAKGCELVGMKPYVAIPEVMNGIDPGDMTEEMIRDQIISAKLYDSEKNNTEGWLRRASTRVKF